MGYFLILLFCNSYVLVLHGSIYQYIHTRENNVYTIIPFNFADRTFPFDLDSDDA